MSKIITFSTKFPAHHPRKGESTDFVGKIWASLLAVDYDLYSDYLHPDGRPDNILSAGEYIKQFGDKQKHHTIREGNKKRVGDFIHPHYWIGRPYHTAKFAFAPPIEIKKIWF